MAVLKGESIGTINEVFRTPTVPRGLKTSNGLTLALSPSNTSLMKKGPGAITYSLYPSDFASATALAAMKPLAPGLLVIINGIPKCSCIKLANVLA